MVLGGSIQAFAELVTLLDKHNSLWSSVCDKTGDWMVALSDDALTEELFKLVISIEGVERIVCGGEITAPIENHPEYDAFFNHNPTFWNRYGNSTVVVEVSAGVATTSLLVGDARTIMIDHAKLADDPDAARRIVHELMSVESDDNVMLDHIIKAVMKYVPPGTL